MSTIVANKPIIKKQRNSNIELLRILAAIGVVILHYNDGDAFKYTIDICVNRQILFMLESIFICAVDLFILISGYFLCCSSKRSLAKVVELPLQVILFKEAFYFAGVIFSDTELTIKSIVGNLIPNNYFVILYIAVYIVSPYINVIFEKMNSKTWKYFMISLVLVFSVWNTFVDLAEEIISEEWIGLSTVTAWGSKQGFNIVNFILMYCIGAYLRFNDIVNKINNKKKVFLAIVVTVLIIYIWSNINELFTLNELRTAWVYHNPFVILMAVLLFILFSNIKLHSKVINELSKAAFTCFLFHGFILDRIGIEKYSVSSWYVMLTHVILSAIIIYFASWIVYKIYNYIAVLLLKPLTKIFIPNIEKN